MRLAAPTATQPAKANFRMFSSGFTSLARCAVALALATGFATTAAQNAQAAKLIIVGEEQKAAQVIKGGATGAVRREIGFERPSRKPRRPSFMAEGGGVRAPYGYERFCRLDPRYCAPPASRQPGALITASRTMLDSLEAFNRGVNAEFEPNDDRSIYGVSDHWTFPSRQADCEDYVLIKQARLLEAGWPRESLLIGVVVGEESPFHAVLIVRTSKGELVLDNMNDKILDWRDTGYSWVIRQSAERPERWVRILDDKQAPSTAAR